MAIRILYLTSTNVLHDGAAQCLMKIVRDRITRGDTPLVVLPEEGAVSEYYRRLGVAVHIVPYNRLSARGGWGYRLAFPLKFWRSIRRLEQIIRQERVDLVHVNELIDFNGLIAARRSGVPAVGHVRMILERPAWLRTVLVRAACRSADRIVCVSESVRQRMFQGWSLKHEQLRVCYDGGPDLERFNPAAVRQGVRAELGIPEEAFLVGLVSKVARVKGHDHLLRAADQIRQSGKADPWYLLVGGPLPGHEDFYLEVQHLIEAFGLKNRVVQTGGRDDVPDLLAAMDVFVHLPSYQDPFPGVVLEALAMERPVVAYDSGGIREQFEPGKSGILIAHQNFGGVAEALLDLYQHPDQRIQMGKKGREYLLDHFSLEKHFDQLNQLYGELVQT